MIKGTLFKSNGLITIKDPNLSDLFEITLQTNVNEDWIILPIANEDGFFVGAKSAIQRMPIRDIGEISAFSNQEKLTLVCSSGRVKINGCDLELVEGYFQLVTYRDKAGLAVGFHIKDYNFCTNLV